MRICAIVLNYRDAARTLVCLRSLVGQGVDTVLVVDNSADALASSELAAATQRLRESGADFDLHVMTPSGNLGFSRGVNAGLASAHAQHCDLVLLINNDAIATPGMVTKLAERLRHEQAGIAIPTVLTADGTPQPRFWYQRFLGLMTTRPVPGAFPFPSGCCLMFHRALLAEGPLFDEDFFMYGEDVLLGWRLARSGVVTHLIDGAVVHHAGRASAGKHGLFYEYHTARAHVLLAMKTWRAPLEIPLLLATKGAGMLLRATWRTLRWRSITPLLASLLAWFPLTIRPNHGKRPD